MSVPMVSLGELVTLYSGGTPPKSRPELWQGPVPWFSAKDMKRDLLSDSADHISEDAFRTSSLRKLPAGTLAMVVRGMILAHTIPISILEVDAAINQDLKALIPKREVDIGYLAAMLRAQQTSILAQVTTAAHGTKKLETHVLEAIHVPLPSLAEQRRVAAILEHLNALRSRQREFVAALDQLPLAHLAEVISAGPTRTALGQLIIDGPKNGLYKPASQYGSGVPIIRIDSFRFGSWSINLDSLKRLRLSDREISEFSVKESDLLINRVNSPLHVGKTALVTALTEPTVFESNMMRLRLDHDKVEPQFLAAFLQTRDVRRQVAPMTKNAVNQASINQRDVQGLMIPLPPLAAQRQFVTRVTASAAVRAQAKLALDRTAELSASLQARAFAGEL